MLITVSAVGVDALCHSTQRGWSRIVHRERRPRLSGWMGHTEIPRPAVVRRERQRKYTDWLDCLLAIWIAEATLESPAGPAAGYEGPFLRDREMA